MKATIGLFTVIMAIGVVAPAATAGHAADKDFDFVFSSNFCDTAEAPDCTNNPGRRVQFQEAHGPGNPAGNTVVLTECTTWVSDVGSAGAFDIPATTVNVTVVFNVLANVESVTVSVGHVAAGGGSLIEAGTSSQIYPLSAVPKLNEILFLTIDTATVGLVLGERLATEVCVDFVPAGIGAGDGEAVISTAGESRAEWPTPPTTFPTPELGTLLLSAVGLVAVGSVLVRRKTL